MSCLQGGNRLFARNRRKGVKKLIEAMSAFEVVDEIPQRHARTLENGRPAQNLRIAVNNRV